MEEVAKAYAASELMNSSISAMYTDMD